MVQGQDTVKQRMPRKRNTPYGWGYMRPCVTVARLLLRNSTLIFSRGHATLHLSVSVGRSVGRSVRPSVRPCVKFLNSERFSHYGSCATVRDWIAVYPALFHRDCKTEIGNIFTQTNAVSKRKKIEIPD